MNVCDFCGAKLILFSDITKFRRSRPHFLLIIYDLLYKIFSLTIYDIIIWEFIDIGIYVEFAGYNRKVMQILSTFQVIIGKSCRFCLLSRLYSVIFVENLV